MDPQGNRNTSNTGISYITAFTFINGITSISGISGSVSNTGNTCITNAQHPYYKSINKDFKPVRESQNSGFPIPLPVVYTSLSELVMAGSSTKSRTSKFNARLNEMSKSRVGAS